MTDIAAANRVAAEDYGRGDVPAIYLEKDLTGLFQEVPATGGITIFTRIDDMPAETPIGAKTIIQADGDVQHLLLEDYDDPAALQGRNGITAYTLRPPLNLHPR